MTTQLIAKNLDTFFTLCLLGSRLNDEMLLLFFHLYTSERDPQDQVILAGGGCFCVMFRDMYCPPDDYYNKGYSIGWFRQGPVGRFTKRCGVTCPSTELTCVPVYWGLQARQ